MEQQTRLSYLPRILEKKVEEVEARRQIVSAAELRVLAAYADRPRGFLQTLRDCEKTALIAEVKKASPSKGLIRQDFRPTEIAAAYEAGGATCLSVLTDETFFQGDDRYLSDIRRFSQLPVLRKDFTIDPYQVLETRAMGADCILLIVAAFSDTEVLREMYELAIDEELDVLVEVHTEKEMEIASEIGANLIGINNRDLTTFETDIAITERLAPLAPKESLLVSESAITSSSDVKRVSSAGAKAVLVGESLLRQDDLVAATRSLIL